MRTHAMPWLPCTPPSPPKPQAEKEILAKGQELPALSFDSNCITPGTVFMDELGRHLRFFIRKKIAEDPLWQTPFVIFSGAWPLPACAPVHARGKAPACPGHNKGSNQGCRCL